MRCFALDDNWIVSQKNLWLQGGRRLYQGILCQPVDGDWTLLEPKQKDWLIVLTACVEDDNVG